MFHEPDFDEDVLQGETLLFWGAVGPRTGPSVVLAETVSDLVRWLRERALVEGPRSALARGLRAAEDAAASAGEDAEVAADALASALEESGVSVFSCGPLARELEDDEPLREHVWREPSPDERAPESVWRGGEAHVEAEGTRVSPAEPAGDELEKAYRMDDELEELAEHQRIDFERDDHREFLAARLDELRSARPPRRASA